MLPIAAVTRVAAGTITKMDGDAYGKRLIELNDRPVDEGGQSVVYWMQRSQRASDNPALSFAIALANDLSKPLVVYLGLDEHYPMASRRAFQFMLEGLTETAGALYERGIRFFLKREPPAEGIVAAARELRACAVVVDEDYLNVGRAWRSSAAAELDVKLFQIDAETVVPARTSDHEEWGAYTLRPKILKALDEHLVDTPEPEVKHRWNAQLEGIDLFTMGPGALADSLDVDQDVAPTPYFTGGKSKARERLETFVKTGLPKYAEERNDIGADVSSGLSPYLHFGQIASKRVALIVREQFGHPELIQSNWHPPAYDSVGAFLEQLIVRRELAINFCLYNPCYADVSAAPDWAANTLREHLSDPRPEVYTMEELEAAATHDDLWNTAQLELARYGKIHPYMRIVWGKKLLEWSPTPAEALSRAIFLNDKYALDGRDPNGYANIAWCILGKHDRPFAERAIFGKVRYMSTAATKRKTHWEEYIARVKELQLPGLL